MAEWQDVLSIAFKFATNCGKAYRSANGRTRKLYNSAMFERLTVRNGEISEVADREPFGALFVLPEFEQGCLERETGSDAPSTNQQVEFVYRLANEGQGGTTSH